MRALAFVLPIAFTLAAAPTFAADQYVTYAQGNSKDLDKVRGRNNVALAVGKKPGQVVAAGAAIGLWRWRKKTFKKSPWLGLNMVATFYDDYTWSYGGQKTGVKGVPPSPDATASNTGALGRGQYKLPKGKRPRDIVGIGITTRNRIFTWFADGTGCQGKIDFVRTIHHKRVLPKTVELLHLCKRQFSYTTPGNMKPNRIVAMAINGHNDEVFSFYKTGVVAVGTSTDLDAKRKPYKFQLPPGVSAKQMVGAAIQRNSLVTTFYWKKPGKIRFRK